MKSQQKHKLFFSWRMGLAVREYLSDDLNTLASGNVDSIFKIVSKFNHFRSTIDLQPLVFDV